MTFEQRIDSIGGEQTSAEILNFANRGPAPVKLALIGGFAPRKCGIATFTTDIFEQLCAHQQRIAPEVWAIEAPAGPAADARVSGRIASDDVAAFRAAALAINDRSYDAVWLQHEYGIFGGDCGEMVFELVERIAAPLIVTLHTVLGDPSPKQREVLERLIKLSSQIMVMSHHSRALLIERHRVDPERITVIDHGAPDRPFGRQEQFKAKFGLAGRPVLMTFGLLGPGKGIETMISALPGIVAEHPDAIYRIVGATHPNLVTSQGEAYREKLVALAAALGVEDNVAFDNRFLDNGELLDQLEACDIYVTPYLNLQQSTSGTLSYAVALGKAVVSTPYVHARELLADGVGVLVEPGSAAMLTAAVLDLLDRPGALEQTQRAAWDRGRTTIWPCFAAASAKLVGRAVAPRAAAGPARNALPSLAAIRAMSDGTGMLQHAIGIIPDRRHGYCIDDNARALLLMLRAGQFPLAEREQLASTYAAFIQHAWNEDRGVFRNFMAYDRSWCEDAGSEDSNGRTAWVLGEAVASGFDAGFREWARRWFGFAIDAMDGVESPRAVAFAMLGAGTALRAGHDHAKARALIERGGGFLHRLLDASRRPDWAWFETVLGYDNARLPQALLEAGLVLDRPLWRDAALDSLAWVAEQQRAASGHFRPVGSEGFGQEFAKLPFDQQPLEAWAAIDAAAAAFAATGEARWLDHAAVAYRWFFGGNDRGVVLADIVTGRCQDGVTPRGANVNCGAESILAFQLASHAMAALGRAAGGTEPGDRLGRAAHPAGDAAAYS
ncbi:glycosyltransferase family 4 protein [Novosphingobium sp. Gsoil 351]|uniref:glycosyltransferase family 4 protein n=1 Tax=Novosphingobium sp. Gsoil 351 TaxID=2675225 RepID=UPI0012B48F58|nr:glycosyltransferase family 4 protein [Novosphingobium sp. Gsoil 351]QGN55265.1 glycosyltransferase [Novosphingobium sp. Gsoil 351]